MGPPAGNAICRESTRKTGCKECCQDQISSQRGRKGATVKNMCSIKSSITVLMTSAVLYPKGSFAVLAYTCTSACSVSNSSRPEQSSKCTHQNYSLLDENAMKMFLATTTEYSIFNAVALPASICSNYCAALCCAHRERSADIK